jgi:Phage portal protein/Phage Mu protein F like protein
MASRISQFIDWSKRAAPAIYRRITGKAQDYNVIGDAATRAAMMPPKPTVPAKPGEAVLSWMLGGYGGPGLWPGSWTANRIEQVQHFRHFVYEAITLTMRLATKEPPLVVKVTKNNDSVEHKILNKNWLAGKGPRPNDRRFLSYKDFGNGVYGQRKMQQMVREHESFEHVEENDPLKKLIDKPNEWDTGAELYQELIMYLELTGTAYMWPVPYKNYPGFAENWILPSHWIWPIRTAKTNKLVDYYECRPIGQTAAAVPFRFGVDELIYYHYKSPLSKIDGSSPLQAGSELIDCFEKTNLARFFSLMNGANIGTVIETDGSTDVNPDQMNRFLAQFKSKYKGIGNFMEPGGLPPGTKLNRPDGDIELAYQASQDQLRDYILSLWNYTKSVMGFVDGINRATHEAALAQAYYLTINPRLSLIDTIQTERLASRFGKEYRIFHRDMTPSDRAQEHKEFELLAKYGLYKQNELRQWMGKEELEGGDEIINPIKNKLVEEELRASRGSHGDEQENLEEDIAHQEDKETGANAFGDKVEDNAERSNEIGSGFKSHKTLSSIKKRWSCQFDVNSCDVCKGLDGEERPIDEPFSNGTMEPPQHPNCHCHLEYD